MMPGGSGDKSGYATMYNAESHNLGTMPVPMLSLASDIDWGADKATIKLIGEWNFSQRTMSYWGEGQTKLIVKHIK